MSQQRKNILGYAIVGLGFLGALLVFVLLDTFTGPKPLNPDPVDWIAASHKISADIEEMSIEDLEISSTAMQAEESEHLRDELRLIKFAAGFAAASVFGLFLVAVTASLGLTTMRPQAPTEIHYHHPVD